jgi:SanA protein
MRPFAARPRGRVGRRVKGLLVLALIATGPRAFTFFAAKNHRVGQLTQLPIAGPKTVGVVFGAGLWSGRPSPILDDRIQAGIALYRAGKVTKLLMSGDNRAHSYNEPDAMRDAALRAGVPAQDVGVDYAGLRSYDTCWRARNVFGIQQAVLVTQDFHVDRALLLCRRVGIAAEGLAVGTERYGLYDRARWALRELPASYAALWDAVRLPPAPVGGPPVDLFDRCAVYRTLSRPGPKPDGC